MSIKTVSLETAKALKDAGFRQNIYMQWNRPSRKPKMVEPYSVGLKTEWSVCAAPTTDELLEELPAIVKEHQSMNGRFILDIKKLEDFFMVTYTYAQGAMTLPNLVRNESLPEALAKMWLWLKKEDLLTAPKQGKD